MASTTYTYTSTTTTMPSTTAFTTAVVRVNPASGNGDSRYLLCDGCMHAKTAAGLSATVYIIGYFILMLYQFGSAANAGMHNLGHTVYVPACLTALFFIFAIVSAVYLDKAFTEKSVKRMNLVVTFVFCSIIYLLYLSITTLLAYVSEGEWIDYMRVQVENGPRMNQGLPKDKSSWKTYRRERMTGRCFTLFSIFLIALAGASYSFAVMETCISYIAELANSSTTNAQETPAAEDPLITSNVPVSTTTTFEMRTTVTSGTAAGATPMTFSSRQWNSRQDSSGSAPPPSYEDVMTRK